ncbi:MAG: glycosyltransferase family 39 protein [Gemmatimonadaceae bacterium]|nr:glycosyltransferase family 39 protein [Gemmatimonadaceae bacterium]
MSGPTLAMPRERGASFLYDASMARALALTIVVSHAVLAWYLRSPGIVFGEDDATYLLLARELRHFSYREVQDIAAPIHARFPPLYPLLLAVVGWPVGDRLDVLYALMACCSAATLLLFHDAARRAVGEQVALAALVVTAFNPGMLWIGGNLMAEAPFTLLVTLALWALVREDESPRYALLAGIAVYLAALTRTAGVVFIPALFAYWVARGRYRRAVWFGSVALVTVGGWLAWTFAAPDPGSRRLYIADIGARGRDAGRSFLLEMLGRMPGRARLYLLRMLPDALALAVVPGTRVDNVAWLVATLGFGAAGVGVLRRRWPALVAFLAAYAALLLVWRHATPRFLTPVTALLFTLLLAGCAWCGERWLPSVRRWVVPAIAALLLAGALARDARAVAAMRACDRSHPVDAPTCLSPDERESMRLAAWVRDSTPPTARLFTSKERAFYWHTGRRTINEDRALREHPDSLAAYLRAREVAYAIVAPVGVWQWLHNDLLARACRDFDVVHSVSDRAMVLHLRAPGEGDDGGASCRALAPNRVANPRRP